jgi:hypothetical protein
MCIVAFALLLATPAVLCFGAADAAADRVDAGSTNVSGVRVLLYSQMCDNGMQHSRLNLRNFNPYPVTVFVFDSQARVTYDPPGPILPGRAKLMHLTAPPDTPGRDVIVEVSNGTKTTYFVPFFPCGGPTTVTNATVVPGTQVRPPDNAVPVVGPTVTPAATPKPVETVVKSGSLPFTGSDARLMAAVATLLVLLGGAFMIVQLRMDCHQNLLVGEDMPRRGILGPY